MVSNILLLESYVLLTGDSQSIHFLKALICAHLCKSDTPIWTIPIWTISSKISRERLTVSSRPVTLRTNMHKGCAVAEKAARQLSFTLKSRSRDLLVITYPFNSDVGRVCVCTQTYITVSYRYHPRCRRCHIRPWTRGPPAVLYIRLA